MERTRLTSKIAHRIADHEGIDVTRLDPPLHEVVDGDALEALVRSRRHERTEFRGTVSFDYRDYRITVDHTGAVSVCPATTADDHPDRTDRQPTDRPVVTQ